MTNVYEHRRKDSRATHRRRRPSPQAPLDLTVPFPLPENVRMKLPREWIVRTALRAALFHLLYAREMIPAPVWEILHALEQEAPEFQGRRHKSVERKFQKCGACLQQLLDEWNLLCSFKDLDLRVILISLGPSWSRPREFYVLDLSDLGDDGETATMTLKDENEGNSHERIFSRRLVRALLKSVAPSDDSEEQILESHPLSHSTNAATSFQAQVSIWVPNKQLDKFLNEQSTMDTSELLPARSLLQRLVSRQSFTIKRRKRRMQPHVVSVQVKGSSKAYSPEWDESKGIWMSLPTSVKGFRL